MITAELWEDMDKVAAAGSAELADIELERANEAAYLIQIHAPISLRDDFQRACAWHIYRRLLIKATENEDTGQMYAAQSSLLSLLD